ncbi:hypothetical protein BGHDH14_bgh02576 [Blumeria hordei DH14]|uniref:TM7S3/TM198-like domain-containing protein n=1 Tax=Blumeria graminis f. sp. hordei (strain DH14) TaxID=546991 RepID=N1JMJ4_BLUG1|nr:hypothetical protein BGHDH14_bgh02576 [Blumeria hordei DH14]
MLRILRLKELVIVLLFLICHILAAEGRLYQAYMRQEPAALVITAQPSTSTENLPSETPFSRTDANGDVEVVLYIPTVSDDAPGGSSTSNPISGMLPTSLTVTPPFRTSTLPLNENDQAYEQTPVHPPITPHITSAFTITGILLILSGTVYTFTGVKCKKLQISFSAAYLTSISVTVLILYFMNLPVSGAIEVAYVAAAVITGLIFGYISILFTEVTEGLGCLFGGFCISMWLLVLRRGGLLTGINMIILISFLTIGAFATSFFHHIKKHSLIIFTSFGGATSIILGIDCFSTAGLKEFWVFLWDLNSNLSLPDTASYALNRKMKVEISSILVIALAGILSQMKLWDIFQARRRNRNIEKLPDERHTRDEEESMGGKIEKNEALAGHQWEATISSDKEFSRSQVRSEYTDQYATKKGSICTTASLAYPTDTEIEMTKLITSPAAISICDRPNISPTSVSVSQISRETGISYEKSAQPVPTSNFDGSGVNKNIKKSSSDSEETLARHSTIQTSQVMRRTTITDEKPTTSSPKFANILRIKSMPQERHFSIDTVATIGDQDTLDGEEINSDNFSRESTLKQNTSESSKPGYTSSGLEFKSDSNNQRFVKTPFDDEIDDRRSSIAATVDDLSDDEELRGTGAILSGSPIQTRFVTGKYSPSSCTVQKESNLEIPAFNDLDEHTAEHDSETCNGPRSSISSMLSIKPKVDINNIGIEKQCLENEEHSKSMVSIDPSQPIGITKGSLSSKISRVVMSHRTNEWAKHLSQAETPDIEDLTLIGYSEDSESEKAEIPVPVKFEELQQTQDFAFSLSPPRSLSKRPSSKFVEVKNSSATVERSNLTRSHTKENVRNIPSENNRSPQSSAASYRRKRRSLTHTYPSGIIMGHENDSKSKFPDQVKAVAGPPQSHQNVIRSRGNTLSSKRDSFIKNSNTKKISPSISTPDLGPAIPLTSAGPRIKSSEPEDTLSKTHINYSRNRPLSYRDNLTRPSSLAISAHGSGTAISGSVLKTFDSHQPQRKSCVINSQVREHQLASWRASVQQDLQAALPPTDRIEQQRTMMRESRKLEEIRQLTEERKKGAREEAWDEMMRSGELLDAHREALRRLQNKANQSVTQL